MVDNLERGLYFYFTTTRTIISLRKTKHPCQSQSTKLTLMKPQRLQSHTQLFQKSVQMTSILYMAISTNCSSYNNIQKQIKQTTFTSYFTVHIYSNFCNEIFTSSSPHNVFHFYIQRYYLTSTHHNSIQFVSLGLAAGASAHK